MIIKNLNYMFLFKLTQSIFMDIAMKNKRSLDVFRSFLSLAIHHLANLRFNSKKFLSYLKI